MFDFISGFRRRCNSNTVFNATVAGSCFPRRWHPPERCSGRCPTTSDGCCKGFLLPAIEKSSCLTRLRPTITVPYHKTKSKGARWAGVCEVHVSFSVGGRLSELRPEGSSTRGPASAPAPAQPAAPAPASQTRGTAGHLNSPTVRPDRSLSQPGMTSTSKPPSRPARPDRAGSAPHTTNQVAL